MSDINRFPLNEGAFKDISLQQKEKKRLGDSYGEVGSDYSPKKARAGKDIGKPGKQFAKIAEKAGKKYGSKAAGKRVAGAVLAKLRKEDETPIPINSGDSEKVKNLKTVHNKSAKELKAIREAISIISEDSSNIHELKETIFSVLSEKASFRLDEMKKSVASNYFNRPSFTR